MAIESLNTPWEGKSGNEVETFLKSQLANLRDGNDQKFGYVEYESGKIIFYDNSNKTNILGSIVLSGNYTVISLKTDSPTSFYVLTSEESHYITITPSSQQGSLGSTNLSDFSEDYIYNVEVDNGNGFKVVEEGRRCLSGSSFNIDVVQYGLTSGSNRIKVVVRGETSQEVKYLIFTATMTTLTLSSNFSWYLPWEQGGPYRIKGLKFSGNLLKQLHIKVGDKQYDQDFSISTNYTTTDYYYELSADQFPGETGVYDVDIWMTGGGISTPHYKYQIMCVAEQDINKTTLICINEIGAVNNYDESTPFKYAVYNAIKIGVDTSYIDSEGEHQIHSNEIAVSTREPIKYTTRLDLESEQSSGLQFVAKLRTIVDGDSFNTSVTVPIDNSNSFIATEGALFRLNPAIRDNTSVDRESIYNTGDAAIIGRYDGNWTRMAWSTDGWTTDSNGHKCLALNAGSTLVVPGLQPLVGANTDNVTVEFMYKVDNVANYDEPIISFMDTESYDPKATNGIIVFPTKVSALATGFRSVIPQTAVLRENTIIHCCIVFQKGYGDTGRNLCMIYINGDRRAVFEYGGQVNWGGKACYLRAGQSSADLYIYGMRVYNKVLEQENILNNYLNMFVGDIKERSSHKKQNQIMESGELNYELVSKLPFNTMVIQTAGDSPIPSYANQVSVTANISFHFNDHPDWDVDIESIPVDGQGTTSKKYYRWNLRGKANKSNTIFKYKDGSSDKGKGYFDGKDNHPKVSKITAKKNVASSMQGHKMGATSFYDELFTACGLKNNKPYENYRVAVYQYPFLGFQKYSDGTYMFIGLYTVGPDKGDSGTFGYNQTDSNGDAKYPSLLSLEGPNHAPLGTRFISPWIDGKYSPSSENYEFGGEEAWDCDESIVGADQVGALMEKEFKPAYDIAYFCSPYLIALKDSGYSSLEELNGDIVNFRNSSSILGNRKNEVLQLYTSDYRIIYYRIKTGKYEILTWEGNIISYLADYLDNRINPTTEELIAARIKKFRAEAGDYWDIPACLFHECFCFLIGAKDNHAKNTYPFKFRTLAEGGRWAWRQDDLDSILATDNNGASTADYFIEVGDVTADGTDIFQGSSSAFWTLLEMSMPDQIQEMMGNIVTNMVDLANQKSLPGSSTHEKMLSLFAHYFWNNSADYFPQLAYNEDGKFAYINIWAMNPNASYNNVYPLTQALGTQYEAEMQWLERRIIYTLSKYSLNGFTGSGDDGYGYLDMTPAISYPINVVPAIDMYPSANSGGGSDSVSNMRGARTKAGEVCTLYTKPSGDTTFYIKSMDYLLDLGDLSGLRINSRGGNTENINFQVASKRLKRLVIGSEGVVTFNATTVTISGDCLEDIDARNVTSINSPINLFKCPRLRKVDFSGNKSIRQFLLPVGVKIEHVIYPDNVSSIFLHTLPLLTLDNIVLDGSKVEALYYNRCVNINVLDLLHKIRTEDSSLRYITAIWDGAINGDAKDVRFFAELTELLNVDENTGYGSVVYEKGTVSNSSSMAYIQGVMNVPHAYPEDKGKLESAFNNLFTLNITDGVYLVFEDDYFMQKAIDWWSSDDYGVSEADAANRVIICDDDDNFTVIKGISQMQHIQGMSFKNCRNLTAIVDSADIDTGEIVDFSNMFNGCVSISELDLSNWDIRSGNNFTNMLKGCANLTKLSLVGWDLSLSITANIIVGESITDLNLSGCKTPDTDINTLLAYSPNIEKLTLTSLDFSGRTTNKGVYKLFGGNNNDVTNLSNLKTIVMENICIPEGNGSMSYTFQNLPVTEIIGLESWSNTKGLTTMVATFKYCTNLTSLDMTGWDMSNVSNMDSMFLGCSSLAEIKGIEDWNTEKLAYPNAMFYGCTSLKRLDLHKWSVSNVYNQASMFRNCSSLEYLDVTGWNCPKLQTLAYMFANCASLTEIKGFDGWDLTNVTTMSTAFHGCKALTDGTLMKGKQLPNCASFYELFYGCTSLTEVDFTGLYTPKLTTIHSLFDGCTNLTSVKGIEKLCTNKIGGLMMVFRSTKLTTLDLSEWDTSNVTNMTALFSGSTFEELDLSNWNTEKLVDATQLVRNCKKLHTLNLSGWDTSKMTGGTWMFDGCRALTNFTAPKAGTLYYSWFSFDSSPLLTTESVDSIIDWLHDYTAEGKTTTNKIVFASTVKKNMTDEQKARITAKGWTLA